VSLRCDDNAKLHPDPQHPHSIATILRRTLSRLDTPIRRTTLALGTYEDLEHPNQMDTLLTGCDRCKREYQIDSTGSDRLGGFQLVRQVRESQGRLVRSYRSRADPPSVLTGRFREGTRPYR
jgi:hypothetical protein